MAIRSDMKNRERAHNVYLGVLLLLADYFVQEPL